MKSAEQVHLGLAISSGRLTAQLIVPGDDSIMLTQTRDLEQGSVDSVITAVLGLLGEFDALSGLTGSGLQLNAVGVAIGGHVEPATGVVVYAPQLVTADVDWQNVPLGPLLEKALQVSVILDNDVHCMAEYYMREHTRDCANFVTVYIAPDIQGVGCALVVDGAVVRGASGGAGEFGHVVVQPGGARCRCGNRGCLQALLDIGNFLRDVNWGDRRSPARSLKEASVFAMDGDYRAKRTFSRTGRYLGQALATVINLLNPERVILGGPKELIMEYPEAGSSAEMFMGCVTEVVREYSFSNLDQACKIEVRPLDVRVAAAGAAHIAAAGPAPARGLPFAKAPQAS